MQEIIQKFAANEDIAKKVYDTYDFTQTVRIEEIGDPGGKFTVAGIEYTRPDGKRYWRVSKPPVSTLKVESYTLEDVNTMISIPLFFPHDRRDRRTTIFSTPGSSSSISSIPMSSR